jgi:hypothetical protein
MLTYLALAGLITLQNLIYHLFKKKKALQGRGILV